MAPQNDQEQPQATPRRIVRIGRYTGRNVALCDRTLTEHALTKTDDNDGVARLDVCGFQSSI